MVFTGLWRFCSRLFDNIHWAPLNVSWERRLQTLCTAMWMSFLYFGEITGVILTIYFLYSDFWLLAILYIMRLANDTEICQTGKRHSEWVKNWSLWKYYRDYFPLKLVKTTELDPTRNYLLVCFPHGVFSFGPVCAFTNNALGFKDLFPGLTCNMMTLRSHFLMPLFRDAILALGFCIASQETILNLLNLKKHRGKCVGLMVGGVSETLESRPGEYKLILKNRKGFARVAMMDGAPLVPVFAFGEIDTFDQIPNPEGSCLRRFQEWTKKYVGLPLLFINGRGIFQYSFGLLPKRVPITTVIGAPMEVKKNLEPTQEEIDQVHAEFIRRLEELFETEKSKYLKDHENKHLVLI